MDLLPNVSPLHQITPCNLHLFWELGQLKQHITWSFGVSKQPLSPELLWLLSEPWPAGQIQLLGCVRNQTSVFAEGSVSQEASLHGPLWSLMCCCSEPTHSHWDALWEMFSLSAAFSRTISLSLAQPLLCLCLPLHFYRFPLVPWSFSLSASLALSTTLTLLSFSLHDFSLLSSLFLPASLALLQLSKTLTLQYTLRLTHSKGRCSTGTLCLLSISQTNGKHSKCLSIPSFHW